ncbi:MAG: MFS transporter [Candidatus Bathyarchaeaceae archaeon]
MLSLRSRDYIAICFLGFGLMLANGMIFPIMSLYAKEFTQSELMIGLTGAVFWITRMFLEVPIGFLSDRTPRYRYKIIFSGIIISGISFAFTGFITDIYQLIGTRALFGVGTVAFFVATLAYVADHFSSETKGKALGILQAIEFSTITIGSALGGYLAYVFGFRPVFIIAALLLLGIFILAITSKILRENEGFDLREKEGRHLRSSFQDLLGILRIKEVAIASFAIFAVMIVDSVLLLIIPLYVKNILGMERLEVGIMTATRGAGIGAGAVLGGFLFDKLHPRMRLINYVLAFAIGGIATFLFTSTNILVLLSSLTFLTGVSFGLVYSTTPALVASSTAHYSVGTAMGSWRIFYDLGGFTSLILLGGIAELMGLVAPFYVTYSFLFLCTILFVLLVFTVRPAVLNRK